MQRNWFINLHFGAKISANLLVSTPRFKRPSCSQRWYGMVCVCVRIYNAPVHIIFGLLDKINWAPR